MRSKQTASSPTSLLVGAVLLMIAVLIGREVSEAEALPVFSSGGEKKISVELVFPESNAEVHQINDGFTICDVIKLTGEGVSGDQQTCSIPLVQGERLLLAKNAHGIAVVEKGWMNAGKRIALSIPLHPDRMTLEDWLVLPGIGAKMAARIEKDRQNNGDFGSVDHLVRVKGIGQKRLSGWRDLFSEL